MSLDSDPSQAARVVLHLDILHILYHFPPRKGIQLRLRDSLESTPQVAALLSKWGRVYRI